MLVCVVSDEMPLVYHSDKQILIVGIADKLAGAEEYRLYVLFLESVENTGRLAVLVSAVKSEIDDFFARILFIYRAVLVKQIES